MANKPTYEEMEQRLKDLERISEEGNRSAEELRKTETRYHKLFESVPVGLYRTTPGGKILEGNPALVEILGYPDLETLMEVNTKGIVDPEYRRQVQTLLEHEGITHDFELRVRRRDGTFIWVQDTARAVRATDGSVLYYEGSLEDITKRKEAEEALRESEERFRDISYSMADWIWEIDRDGRYTFVSEGEKEILGYDPEELIGRTSFELRPEGEEKRIREAFKIIASEKKPIVDLENWNLTKEGQRVCLLTTSVPILNDKGELCGYRGVDKDITEQKRMQEALRESEEKYRTTFESTGTATAIVEEDTTISLVNTECTKIFGYSKEELEGKKSWTEFVTKEDLERMKEYHDLRRTAEGDAPRNYEFRSIDRHGNVRDIFLTIGVIPGTKKSVASLLDITERKRLETQLQHTQKMESVGALAGGMAHEFNNLMTAVMSYSSFLLADLGQDDPMRNDVEEIKKAGKRASSLVKQLLAFSRRQVLQPVVLDLNGVLTDTDKILGHLIGEDVELKMELEHDLDKVKVDPIQMEQVIMNLAVNAKDAMPEGGKFTIETANVEIDEFYVSTHGDELKPGPYVMLAMSDTGMGMDKETQSQIFEPFFTTKETDKGTGLGLSTVYGIVRQSGGDIKVYSESEKGTMFKIYLPRLEQDVEVAQEADLQMEGLGGSETVLLVEDNDLVRKVSRRCLEQYGYRILEAEDARKALMMSEQHEGLIDLMVTDVVMPEMSGKELAERLQPIRTEMKVLYMSGYADNAVIRRGVTDIDVAFLEKPFTPAVFAGKVRQVLDETEKRKSR